MGNFKIGEKVVCVDPCKELVKNQIYTIRGIYKSVNGTDYGVYLEEIIGEFSNYWEKEIGYNVNRFRKLDYEFAENLLAEISEAMKSETIKN